MPCSDSVTSPQPQGACFSITAEHFAARIKLTDMRGRLIVRRCHSLWDDLPAELHSPLRPCYIRNTQHPSTCLNAASHAPALLPQMLLTAGKRMSEQAAFDRCSSLCLGHRLKQPGSYDNDGSIKTHGKYNHEFQELVYSYPLQGNVILYQAPRGKFFSLKM